MSEERWGVLGLAVVGGLVLGPTITLATALILGVDRKPFGPWYVMWTVVGDATPLHASPDSATVQSATHASTRLASASGDPFELWAIATILFWGCSTPHG